MRRIRRCLWKRWCAGVSAVCIAATGALFGGVPGNPAGDTIRDAKGFLAGSIVQDAKGIPAGDLRKNLPWSVPGSIVSAEETDTAMGRYLESEVTLPEGCDEVRDVVRTTEGTLRIIGQSVNTDNKYRIWDSADGGVTWEQTGELSGEDAEEYFSDIDLSPDGGGILAGLDLVYPDGTDGAESSDDVEIAGASAEAGEDAAQEVVSAGDSVMSTVEPEYCRYLIPFDAQGSMKDRTTCDESYTMEFAQNGELAGFAAGKVALFDRDTGEVTDVIAEDGEMIGICGQELLVLTGTELRRYDITSGEPLARDEALDDALFKGVDPNAYSINTNFCMPIVMAEDEEGRLYYATQKGIFAHMMDGGVVEQIVDGTLCSLSAQNAGICSMAVLDQCFYVLFLNGGSFELLKYQYSADVPSVPQNELTVYSLQEDYNIRQVIVQFQKLYPDTYVDYEIGMSGADGVTVSDALRTLNTEILAGSGPDILLLNGLPVDTYTEQGLLADLSGVAAELQDSEGLLENVTGAFEYDGILPAIPARFGIVAVAGDPELSAGIDSPAALEPLAAQEGVLDAFQIVLLPDLLYRVCAGSWENEDNTLNQEKLADYVNTVVRITDTWKEHASEKDLERLKSYQSDARYDWNVYQDIGLNGDDMGLSVLDLLTDPQQVRPGALYNIRDYCGLCSVNLETGVCAVLQPELSGEKFFVPCCMLGIVSTSKMQEQAAEFVKYMLSGEGQNLVNSDGFPVNRSAFEHVLGEKKSELGGIVSSISGSDGEDSYVSLDYRWPAQEELDVLYEMAQQVTAPVETGRVQHDVVIEEIKRCLSGAADADETVNAILQRINLYLAE